MKKLNLVLTSFIIASSVVGIGYGSWTEEIFIDNTVTTGNISVELRNNNGYPNTTSSEHVKTNIEQSGDDSRSMNISIADMYPGSYGAFRFMAENTGSIPTKIESIQVDFDGDIELLKYFTYETGIEIDEDGDGIIDKEGYSQGDLINFEKNINELINDSYLQIAQLSPNCRGKIYFNTPLDKSEDLNSDGERDKYVVIRLKDDIPKEYSNKTFNFTIKSNFKQFNIN